MLGSTIGPAVAAMVASDREQLKNATTCTSAGRRCGGHPLRRMGKCGKGSRTRIGTTEGGSRRFSTCIAHAFGLLQFSQAPLLPPTKYNIASGPVQPQAARDGIGELELELMVRVW